MMRRVSIIQNVLCLLPYTKITKSGSCIKSDSWSFLRNIGETKKKTSCNIHALAFNILLFVSLIFTTMEGSQKDSTSTDLFAESGS